MISREKWSQSTVKIGWEINVVNNEIPLVSIKKMLEYQRAYIYLEWQWEGGDWNDTETLTTTMSANEMRQEDGQRQQQQKLIKIQNATNDYAINDCHH